MKKGERGFTLVELLVSLAIMGAAAGLLVSALGTGGQVAGRMESRAASGETVAAAQAILRDRIERLLADTGDGTGQTTQASTIGTATRFTFIAPAAGNRPGTGMQRYYLALGTDRTLDLAAIDSRQKAELPAQWRIDPLIGNVAAIDLAYYGLATDGQMRWQSEWVGRTDPPALVRLRLRFNDGDGRFWPELVIRPATTVSTACALDFNTGTCRAS